jgi:hypothetical protein
MKNSSNQDNKLKIIEKIILLNDDDVLKKIETIIIESQQKQKPDRITKPNTIRHTLQPNKVIEGDAVFSQDEVEKLTQDW